MGTSISSQRVPGHSTGVESEREYLLSLASSHGFASREEYEKTLALAKKILDMPHRIVFTHGDLKAHNILVNDEGHLSGFLDWECAGWCPEYWDFTTAMRFGRNSWWYQVASILGGDQYSAELECDVALNLTVDSYSLVVGLNGTMIVMRSAVHILVSKENTFCFQARESLQRTSPCGLI